jgi:hypothetical protein
VRLFQHIPDERLSRTYIGATNIPLALLWTVKEHNAADVENTPV